MTNREWLEKLSDEQLSVTLMGSFEIALRIMRSGGELDEEGHKKWLQAEHTPLHQKRGKNYDKGVKD